MCYAIFAAQLPWDLSCSAAAMPHSSGMWMRVGPRKTPRGGPPAATSSSLVARQSAGQANCRLQLHCLRWRPSTWRSHQPFKRRLLCAQPSPTWDSISLQSPFAATVEMLSTLLTTRTVVLLRVTSMFVIISYASTSTAALSSWSGFKVISK